MGSSDEINSKAIDASVGGLVWVRRRNGSWWPGRIMSHHEVPDSSIVSPKSGTPIKLLGRDDASVDWYNLEKSKRVKAFRCGEYDACIETAKATASSTTSKKAVKYARREDAIVHALEIEKASASGEGSRRCLSRKGNEDSTDVAKTEDTLQSRKTNKGKASKAQTLSEKRRRTPNDSEEDGTEGNKRMRVLEDIGMGIRSKVKKQVNELLEANQENGFESDTDVNGSVPNGTLASSRDSSPSMKRKRSPVVNANEYSKRKKRQRPLTKVLESTAMVSVPVTCDDLANSDCLPHSNNSDSNEVSSENVTDDNDVEATDNKATESEIPKSVFANDDSSNELFDVPLIGEENYSAGISTMAFTSSSPSISKASVSGQTRRCGQSSHDDVGKNEGCNGSDCIGPAATLIKGIEKNTTIWLLKGKRKSRQMSKKQEERIIAYAEESKNISRPHCSVSDHNPHDIGRTQLYDVKIEEKANYKPRNVPMISLRSKLNCVAIIGHPLTVEVLETGSCDHMVYSHINSIGVPMVDDDTKPKPSSKKKSKKKKTHIPSQKSSKSKKSSPLSKKTRRLSALSGQNLTVNSKKKVIIAKAKEGIVSCIPLKIVFSRINEAVKGSARQGQRTLPSTCNT